MANCKFKSILAGTQLRNIATGRAQIYTYNMSTLGITNTHHLEGEILGSMRKHIRTMELDKD